MTQGTTPLKRILTILSRHVTFIAILTALMVGATAVASFRQPDRYRSGALLEVQAPVDDDGSISYQGTLTARERAVTISVLGNTAEVYQRVASRLQAPVAPYECSISQIGQSEFVSASCTSGRRNEVADLANLHALSLQALLEDRRQDRIKELTRLYELQIKELRSQGVPPENFPTQPVFPNYRELEVIDEARAPLSPYAPNPERNVVIALVLGLLINAGLAVLLEYAQGKAHDAEDVERGVEEPILGTIPIIRRRHLVSVPGERLPAAGQPRREPERR